MRLENTLLGWTAATLGTRATACSCASLITSGFMVTVRSARRVEAISRSIACCSSEGTAKMPMLATAIASVRRVKQARALRRVRSVIDLRAIAVAAMMPPSIRGDDAVADRDHPVSARGELEVVSHEQHRGAVVVEP